MEIKNDFLTEFIFIHKRARLSPTVMAGHDESSAQLIQAKTRIWNQTLSLVNSATLKCAVQLGLFDAIHNHGKPMALSDLVGALKIKPEKAHGIRSLMRVLVRNSFIAKSKISDNESEEGDDDDNGGYVLTPASRLLLQDDIYNIKPYVLFTLDPICTKSWDYLSEWFQNDDSTPFSTANGKSFWDYHASDPRIQNVFDEAMATDSRLITSLLLKECKEVFQGLTSLVDVAGGTGTMTRAIAQTFPNLKCTVFDQPHVIANLQGSGNLDFVGGDMFQSIPPGNAILLKWILHDWNDQDCVKILKKCKEAIPSKEKGGKIIVIDIIIRNQYDRSEIVESQVMFDMLMMVLYGAKERTLKEWDKLFSDAGFSHYEITNVLGSRSLIELYP